MAFESCISLSTISLQNGIKEIGFYVFKNCTDLTSVSIPQGLNKIGFGAFEGCTKLTSISLPDELTNIDSNVFSGCENLELKKLPKNLYEIGNDAFLGCKKIQLETLPNGLNKIGFGAFEDTGISIITIPASVGKLGYGAFDTRKICIINLEDGSPLGSEDIQKAYGSQLKRIVRYQLENLQISPVEFNAAIAKEKCPYCLCNFGEGEEIRKLKCGHYVHLDCFNEDLEVLREGTKVLIKCPLCREIL